MSTAAVTLAVEAPAAARKETGGANVVIMADTTIPKTSHRQIVRVSCGRVAGQESAVLMWDFREEAWMEAGPEPIRAAVERRTLVSTSPIQGDLLGEVLIHTAEEVRAVVARSRVAQRDWALFPIEQRCEKLAAFRDAMIDRAEEIVEILVRETGKPRSEALIHEVIGTADFASYYIKRGPRILAPHEYDSGMQQHRRAYIHYAPLGVVAVISPWNFPVIVPMPDVVAALVAGNSVVIKPSEVTPLVTLKIKEIFDASGLPADLFLIVTGEGPTGAALIDAMPNKVVFTGAVSTGRRVGAACAERLIPCTLELGGKAAAIVCGDADVEKTARLLVYGGFANSGQICVSVERVLAHGAVHDALVARVTELVRALRQGNPLEFGTDVGAITFSKQIEVAERLIADAVSKGACVATGGQRLSGKGQFFQPTVLTGCTPGMAVMQEEIFGPVLPIMRVTDEEEAIRIANDSHLGLMGYVFGTDREAARRVAERVEAGMVMINDVILGYAQETAPLGGLKQSGMGRVHGEEGLRALCQHRVVTYERFNLPRAVLAFPYSERVYRAATKAMRLLFRRGSPVGKILKLF